MQDQFAIERHVQLMMLAHAYFEMARQDALAAWAEPDVQITLGDIQRQHQALSRPAEMTRVFDLTHAGFELESIHQRLAA